VIIGLGSGMRSAESLLIIIFYFLPWVVKIPRV